MLLTQHSCGRADVLPWSTTEDKKPSLPFSFPVILFYFFIFNTSVSILPQLWFQQFFSQVCINVLASLSSAVLVIAQQPPAKGSAKGSLILSYLLPGPKEINIYAGTCEVSHCVRCIWGAGKGQTSNPNYPISPQEALNSDGSHRQRKEYSSGRSLSVFYFPL